MLVIPVIDLMGGQVVRGVAGRRSEYRPVESRIAGDARPVTVARAFVDEFGFEAAYVADLDAIVHGRYSSDAWREVADAGLKLWLDAGIGICGAAQAVQRLAADAEVQADLVIGLESLVSVEELVEIWRLSVAAPIFSLDMQGGQPWTRIEEWKLLSPMEIVERVVEAGMRRIIVLDLADVGVGGGTRTRQLCQAIRREYPRVELIAGGGVRGIDDLRSLADAGCDAALVASALHDGRLSRADVCLRS
jgi:phosphoribosylformimino-5-aminoimidazole carboxamide ribotide isomerase